jgi:hypothetical protein
MLLAIPVTILLSGCGSDDVVEPEQVSSTTQTETQAEKQAKRNKRVSAISKYPETSNVQAMSGGYIVYDITTANGIISCREHYERSELACWSNK